MQAAKPTNTAEKSNSCITMETISTRYRNLLEQLSHCASKEVPPPNVYYHVHKSPPYKNQICYGVASEIQKYFIKGTINLVRYNDRLHTETTCIRNKFHDITLYNVLLFQSSIKLDFFHNWFTIVDYYYLVCFLPL